MKETYVEAEMEIVELDAADIIATSGYGVFDEDELPPLIIK